MLGIIRSYCLDLCVWQASRASFKLRLIFIHMLSHGTSAIMSFRDSSLVLLWIRPPFYVRHHQELLHWPLRLTGFPGLLSIIFNFYSFGFSWYFSYHVVQGFLPCFMVDLSTFLYKASSGVIASTFVSDRLPRPPLNYVDFYSYVFLW